MILKTNFTDAIRIMRNSGQSVFSEENKKKFGTIYTPEFVVEKTVDLAWKYLPEGVNKLDLTYCDPAVGDGNFLEYLYEKLMQETSIEDPVKRSRYILTKCLFGFEILEPMVQACKIRMIMLHQHTINQHGGDRDELLTLFDELQIYHGNTICLPADTQQEWYQNRQADEGGLLPEELRERKFDVIVGNPPYCDMCDDNNVRKKTRPYSGYQSYTDLAQCFVKWSFDHLTDDGICGLNTNDSWLNDVKIGSNATKRFIFDKFRVIFQDDRVKTYSAGAGGSINTMICVFSTQISPMIEYHHDSGVAYITPDLSDMQTINFLRRHSMPELGFASLPMSQYCQFATTRNAEQQENPKWNDIVLDADFDTLIFNYILTPPSKTTKGTFLGGFKLSKGYTRYASKTWKLYAVVDSSVAIWLIGCLNTTKYLNIAKNFAKILQHGNDVYRIRFGVDRIRTLPVPDFDYYKTNYPERHATFLTWIEANMRDKDAFLAGIDEQFEKLIENTEG